MTDNFELLETGQIEIMHEQAHSRQSETDNCDALRQQHDSLAAELVKRGVPHDTEMVCPESALAQAAPNYRHGFTDDVCNHCAFGQLYPYCNLYKADYTYGYTCDSFQYFEVLELEPPHGFLMASGKQTAIASNDVLLYTKPHLIVSNGEAFGIAEFEPAAQVKTKEFDNEQWASQHRITQRERRQWWPDTETFYVYRLKAWHPYSGITLYEDGKVINEPKLTARQWQIVSAAKELPKQIILLDDAVSITEKQEFVFNLTEKCKELDSVLSATYQADVKEAKDAKELIPLYSLALVRNPRMRVSKKNIIAEGDPKGEKQEDEDMPYRIVEREDEYCVVKVNIDDTDGDVAGCHETEDEAEAQLAALRINVEAEEGESARHTDKPKKRKPKRDNHKATRLGDFLRSRREELEMSIADVAAQAPVTASTVGDIESGEIEIPSEPVLEALASALNISIRRLRSLLPSDAMPAEMIARNQYGTAGTTFFNRLKRAAKSIIDLISLAETEKENEVKLFMNEAGIGQKMVDGELWHFTYSTNAFQDREGETFSTKSLERYVAAAKEKDDRGFFNLWHIAGTDFARKEWQEVIGRFLVEAGPYLDNEQGRAAAEFFKQHGAGHPEFAPEGWGCSPEYKYLPEERATTVYENIWITRTSTLPKMAAANIWTETRQLARQKMAYSEDQIKAAIAVFKDEAFVKELFDEGETKTAELEAAGVAHKENKETKETESEQPAQEIQLNMEDLAAEVGKQFQADLTPIGEAIVTMANDLKEMRERLEKLEETKNIKDKTETPRFVFNMKRASEDVETIVTDDDLKNQKPTEAKSKDNDPWAQTFNK